ncbi:MAG: hypothetical protein ABSA27_03200 [Terriglobales bacterium]|jgi:hypothetical protein
MESLALDHAPFARMSPSGTFVSVCVLLGESRPYCGLLSGPVPWPQDNDNSDMDPARTINKRKNREYIFLLEV